MCLWTRSECSEACKVRRREMDNEVKQILRELKLREDQIRQLERETLVGHECFIGHGLHGAHILCVMLGRRGGWLSSMSSWLGWRLTGGCGMTCARRILTQSELIHQNYSLLKVLLSHFNSAPNRTGSQLFRFHEYEFSATCWPHCGTSS